MTGLSGSASSSYAYDASGNRTSDSRKGLTMSYNILNLPKAATKSGSSLTYVYLSPGTRDVWTTVPARPARRTNGSCRTIWGMCARSSTSRQLRHPPQCWSRTTICRSGPGQAHLLSILRTATATPARRTRRWAPWTLPCWTSVRGCMTSMSAPDLV